MYVFRLWLSIDLNILAHNFINALLQKTTTIKQACLNITRSMNYDTQVNVCDINVCNVILLTHKKNIYEEYSLFMYIIFYIGRDAVSC